MKFKFLIITLALCFGNYIYASADITQGSLSNVITQIASSSSFTPSDQNNPETISEIQSQTVSAGLESEQLEQSVDEAAESFVAVTSNSSSSSEGEVAMVTIGGNPLEGRTDLEPTLDTLIYDTGLMKLEQAAGAQYVADSTNIFQGDQFARIKVFIDFKKEVQYGFVESHITLTTAANADNSGKKMVNVFDGGAKVIGDGAGQVELPIDSELIHSISSDTGNPLRIDDNNPPASFTLVDNDESPYSYDKHSINSLLKDNSTPTSADYIKAGFPEEDLHDMIKNVSHGGSGATLGDKAVLVQAKFTTVGEGTPGTSTASFEVTAAGACAADISDFSLCTSAEKNAFTTGIVRLEKTVTTEAVKHTGPVE
jgi:hypothetical protein